MVDSSRTIMTDAGFALETRVRADETKMQFTRAAISTDDHFSDTDDALAKLTELSNIQQDGKVTAVQVINTTTVYVQVDVNQAESKADYQMRSAALYAKDDDGTEVLYGVTVLQDPVFVHKDADGSYLGFGINTTVGRASNVVVVVDPANMVTQQVFEGTMKNYYTKAEVDVKFVTDDDFASKLPKNIATTDAANTFAKSQTLAGGATDGKGNAYATTKDVATGLNNGLSTKVTDNHDGTEQLNGVQVQPFNKLSDTIGGRNLLPISNYSSGYVQVSNGSIVPADGTAKEVVSDFVPVDITQSYYCQIIEQVNNNQVWFGIGFYDNNKQFISRYGLGSATVTGTITSVIRMLPTGFPNISIPNVYTASFPANTTYVRVSFRTYGNPIQASLEKSSVLSDWTPAPEDKVNVSDMRKPASDVAGIEEVNAKQDKIGYTPADDSKVVHSTVTILNSTDMDTVLTAGFYQSISGTNGIPSGDNWTIYQVIPLSSVNGVQVAYETNNAILGMRSWNGGSGKISFTSWVQFADDSKVVHNSEIDPSVMVKTTLTAADDVLNLADGTYRVWQVVPKNLPAIGDGSGSDWGYVTVKSISAGTRWVEYTNIFRRRRINVYSGSPATWSGWYMPNENSVVKDNGDSTVTVDGRKFVPADTDHTIPVSEAGVAGPANFAAGTLKVDDLEVLGAKVFSDTEDYKTFAAAHPSAITIVTHDTSTS
ncbi:pyocin knob domain-containing protein [Levilactobacillus brevis]|uniref:pyocin knob domain-containing protein n=1 Tax=Levilactobacillus brevis TaxID=1580 RepID=UPI0035168A6F